MKRILVFSKKVLLVILPVQVNQTWEEVEEKAKQYAVVFGAANLRIIRADY
jgi:hypothetical protein